MPSVRPRSHVPLLLFALALGGTGFAAGFFGPIALNPEANQGPLVGLFITGPLGALGGLLLGTFLRFLSVTDAFRIKSLMAACALLGLGTLFYCLPEPAVRGHVIEAEVTRCAPPIEAFPAALTRWRSAVERTTWATPPADWQQVARRNVERDPGVVLALRVVRRSTIYVHRKPWNAGATTAGPWAAVDAEERYYARDEGSACDAYLARERRLYTPFVASRGNPREPAAVWPPTDTTGFLSLMELGPVPAEYRRLLAGSARAGTEVAASLP
jgi:hypothetical protein